MLKFSSTAFPHTPDTKVRYVRFIIQKKALEPSINHAINDK